MAAGQGFLNAVAAATPTDYSITLRGIKFTPGEFSDLEVGPLNALGSKLESGDWASGMTGMMEELYRSLKTIYGDVIDQFHNPATGRLTLYSPEILLLANAAMNKLAADPHYRAGTDQAEKTSTKLTAGADFAGAVAAKLAPVPDPEAEIKLHAEMERQQQINTQINNLSAQLAQLRADEGI